MRSLLLFLVRASERDSPCTRLHAHVRCWSICPVTLVITASCRSCDVQANNATRKEMDQVARPLNAALMCRICLNDDKPEAMIAPCKCSGSQMWVHRFCLDEWRAQERVPLSLTHCCVCKGAYVIDTAKELVQMGHKVKFGLLVSRDVFLFFFVMQTSIAGLGIVLHAVDRGINCPGDDSPLPSLASIPLWPVHHLRDSPPPQESLGTYLATTCVMLMGRSSITGRSSPISIPTNGRMRLPSRASASVPTMSRHLSCFWAAWASWASSCGARAGCHLPRRLVSPGVGRSRSAEREGSMRRPTYVARAGISCVVARSARRKPSSRRQTPSAVNVIAATWTADTATAMTRASGCMSVTTLKRLAAACLVIAAATVARHAQKAVTVAAAATAGAVMAVARPLRCCSWRRWPWRSYSC